MDSANSEREAKRFYTVLDKMATDEILKTEFGQLFNIAISRIVVAEYDNADWKVIMEQNPHLVLLTHQCKDGEFHLILEVTFILEAPKMRQTKGVDKLCKMMNCKALIEYPGYVHSRWILVHGNNTFQHVSIDPDEAFSSDSDAVKFIIEAYGDFLDSTELSNLP